MISQTRRRPLFREPLFEALLCSLAQSYSYISTPSMVLTSATDTTTLANVCQVTC